MINPLRKKLRAGATTFGMWVTVESPNVTEAVASLGIDWVLIEMEHGNLGWEEVANHLRALGGSETAGLIRVSELRRETIQRSLDLGAHGIIVPMIGNAEALEQAYQLGRYPPRGVRGVAGERCVRWGLESNEYLHSANEETLIIPLLETREAVANVDAILEVDGLEAIFFGPADLSASFGYLGEWEGGPVIDAINNIRQKATAKNIACGIIARNDDEGLRRCSQGFQMIGLGAEINLMMRAVQSTMKILKSSAVANTGPKS
jgi:2-keto-3-deoxy-L-rhamnonate aldolase RhmA